MMKKNQYCILSFLKLLRHTKLCFYAFAFLAIAMNTYAQENPSWEKFLDMRLVSIDYEYIGSFSKESKDRVSSLITLRAGDMFSRSEIRRNIESVYSLGEFSDVKVDTQEKQNGVDVRFILVKKTLAGSIRLNGNESQSEKSIRDVIRLREGQEYDRSIAERDAENVRKFYASLGYLSANVSFSDEIDNRSQEMIVNFNITENKRPTVRKVIFTGTNRDVIDPINLLKSMKDVKINEAYKGKKALDKDVKIIEDMYRQREFLTAKVWRSLVLTDPEAIKEYNGKGKHFPENANIIDNDSAVVVIEIDQGKRVYIKINGNENIKDKELKKAIAIQRMHSVSDSVIRRSREDIEKIYKDNGYYMVGVSYVVLKDKSWDFNVAEDIEGWKSTEGLNDLVISGGILNISKTQSIQNDEIQIDTSIYKKIQIRMRANLSQDESKTQNIVGRLNWITNKSEKWDRKKSQEFQIEADSQFHDYEIPLYKNKNWSNTITGLRISTANIMNYHLDIESIKIITEFIPVVFDIIENKQMRISRISISPKNLDVNENKIKKQMLTREKSFFSFWVLKRLFHEGILDETVLQEDIRAIVAFYKDNGYTNPSIERKITTDTEKGEIYVDININEGPRAFVKELILDGDNRNALSDEEILSKLSGVSKFSSQDLTTEGTQAHYRADPPFIFREYDLAADSSNLASRYANKGYFAEIRHSAKISDDIKDVTIIYQIDQGKQIRLDDKIEIHGNTRTKSYIIERELSKNLTKDRVFSLDEIEKSTQRIRDLGLFENVKPDTQPILGSDDLYRLIIDVKERNSKSFDIHSGFSSSGGLRGGIEASHINLAGTGRKISGKGQIGTRQRKFETEYIEPRIFGTNAYGLVNIYPYTELYPYTEPSEKDFMEIRKGINAGISWRFYSINTLKLDYEYDILEYDQLAVKEVTKIGRIGTIIQRDGRDNFLNPKKGSFNSLTLEYANPLLGGFETFTKLSMSNIYFTGLFKGLVLALGARTGYSWGLDENNDNQGTLTPRLFRMVDYQTPRGYKWSTQDTGSILLNVSLETRIPIYEWTGFAIGFATFVDSGHVYNSLSEMDIREMRSAVGIGIRLITPVGPFRIDYGYALKGGNGIPEIAFGNAF